MGCTLSCQFERIISRGVIEVQDENGVGEVDPAGWFFARVMTTVVFTNSSAKVSNPWSFDGFGQWPGLFARDAQLS
jgi:hypothetical protein